MIALGRQRLTLAQLRSIARDAPPIALDSQCLPGIDASVATIARIVAGDAPAYGINTGFGKLAQQRIAPHELVQLQRNIVLSHAAGTGALLSDHTVRLILALKIASLAQGHSGVRRAIIGALVDLYNNGIYPCIPSKGSVGASGDLAPLAHMSAALLGVGEVRVGGVIKAARDVVKPIELGPKEGLALLNGTLHEHCPAASTNTTNPASINPVLPPFE